MPQQAIKKTLKTAPIPAQVRSFAEEHCKSQGQRLTVARLGAYAEMLGSEKALSAYDLIALLEKRQGRKIAPLTVYRHLDFLTTVGLVHRIESTQSYLPCTHPEHEHTSQYLLCSDCGSVEEVHSDSLESSVEKIAAKRGFQTQHAVIEIKGICTDCAE